MAPSPTTPGIRRLGRYEILGRIATGGMATVYLARLEATGGFAREFALKVIHPHLAEEPGFASRFVQEARLASRVRHPNAVTTIDAGTDQGYSYLVLELIDGVNLRQLVLHRARPMSPMQAACIAMQVARGLAALHTAIDEKGRPLQIIHRDLSPHNIMLDREGRAILIDLGLAKGEHGAGVTEVGVLAGKLPYMSPEQASIEELDARSDIFSLGTVLFELVTGGLPFGDTHTPQTLRRLQECDPRRLEAALAQHGAPTWLIEIVLVCLRKDPNERFATAEDLAEALAQELVSGGHDEPTIRRRLASVVTDAAPEIGAIESAGPLVPRIGPAASSTRPGSAGWRPAARWAALGALVAAAGLGGMQIFGLHGDEHRGALDGASLSDPHNLAADEASPAQRDGAPWHAGQPQKPRATSRDRPSAGSAPDADSAEGDQSPDDTAGPRAGRRKARASRRRPPELKPNPYEPR